MAKVDLQKVDVLDFFGGIKHVDINDYFNANITFIINKDFIFNEVHVLQINNL